MRVSPVPVCVHLCILVCLPSKAAFYLTNLICNIQLYYDVKHKLRIKFLLTEVYRRMLSFYELLSTTISILLHCCTFENANRHFCVFLVRTLFFPPKLPPILND